MPAEYGGLVALMLLGCSSTPNKTQGTVHHGYIDSSSNYVWARGSWPDVTPSRNVDEVIDRLCPAIMKLDGATWKDHGKEYCGVIYTLGDGLYRVTYPSPLGRWELTMGQRKKKSCYPVRKVVDPNAEVISILADYHSHPWYPSPLSPEDLMGKNQLYYIKIQFDSECHIMKLVPHMGNQDKPGEVYERRRGQWVQVGLIKPENKTRGLVAPLVMDD